MSALLHGTNAFLEGQERLVDGRTFRMHTRVAASRLHRVRRPLAPRQVHESDLAQCRPQCRALCRRRLGTEDELHHRVAAR